MTSVRFFISMLLSILVAGAVWVAGGGGAVSACSCAPVTEAEAFELATDVFVGRVQDIDDSREFDQADRADDVFVRYVMEVDGVFKGTTLATQVVATGQRGGGCGVEMLQLGSYLVYAHRRNGQVSTSLCSGNVPASVTAAEAMFGAAQPPVVGIDPAVADIVTSASPDVEVSLKERSLAVRSVVFGGAFFLVAIGLAAAGVVLGRRARTNETDDDTLEQ